MFRLSTENWQYQSLPSNSTSTASRTRKGTRQRLAAIYLLCAVLLIGVCYWVFSAWAQPRYNPLDNYQNINHFSTLHSTYRPSSPSRRTAVVSTLYTNNFAPALAVLGHSVLAQYINSTAAPRLLLPYLPDRISTRALCLAQTGGWEPVPVERIPPPHGGRGIHHRFSDQYTKLNIWKLDQMGIDRAVYLDGDTLARGRFDELFDLPWAFAAVPDVYGPRDSRGFSITFNAGVLAFQPSTAVFTDIMRNLESAQFPLQQAEQAFLNLYFGAKVVRLPYAYNANLALKARSPELWNALEADPRVVHYTMAKPFLDDAKSPETVLSVDEIWEAVARAERADGGFYVQEVRWWRDAFDEMFQLRGREIEACYAE